MQISDQQRIGERYDLQRVIGVGGMARVYLAHDRWLNREVAAKILDPALAADPTFVERFRREAQAAAALNHPNIVTIFDTGATEDSYFIVMEYVPGPNLKEDLLARGPLPETDALAIGAQIATALAAAHHRGLIHRDIKPHNVLLTPEGRAKVTDFGIARAAGASPLTATQVVMGSAQYIAPEQALHQPVDGRTDLYSLGIVLYELLAGRPPFAGDSLVAVAMQQVHAPLPSLRALRPDLAPETEAVITRALAKDPAARFPTADAMRHALDAARQRAMDVREVTAALPLPPRTPAPPATRRTVTPRAMPLVSPGSARRPRLLFALLGLVPLVLLLIGGGWFLSRRSTAAPVATATPSVPTRAASGGQPTIVPAPTATQAATAPPPSALLPTAPPAPTAPPTPTAIPATPTPLAPPTAPPATATVPPEPTQPPPPTPTSVPAQPTRPPANTANASPQQAVQSFYQLVAARRFDEAAQLWSPRMRAQYNTETAINGRFADTQALQVTIGAVQVNQGEGRATVAVDITETRGGTTQRIVGAWQLVRTPSGWLLDQPNF